MFAAAPKDSTWIPIPTAVQQLLRQHRKDSGNWSQLVIDIDPGQPPQTCLKYGQSPALKRLRNGLVGLSAISLIVAATLQLWMFFGPKPSPIPVDVAPPVSALQQEAQDLVRAWFDNEKSHDPVWLRQLACAAPSGLVAEELTTVESGPAGREAEITIAGFTDFVDGGSYVQIKVFYTAAHPLTSAASRAIAEQDLGYFIWTFVMSKEDGTLRMCSG
ncbi:hypothetical protein [Mycobacteroides chelonae]|uniref:hypothetical protein n=1 Tax=Mycobacteroides chelonae TaxID=1774 RepID=UPI0008A84B90|nr:hypothetical protein [Mycobacteroides chelonae]AYM40715.1 hypothetical protein DYE20_03315 [[Mycobacterium] chelonae subsp. gwanakae]